MSASDHRSAIRRVPWGLVGALLLILLAERALSRRIKAFTTETAGCWKYAATTARTTASRSEILGFGDSLMKYGFQPRVIEARTGRSAFNLAVYGGPPSHDYLSLRRVLDAGGKPAALVVCFQPIHFGSGPRYHAREFAEGVSANEAIDLAWSSSDPGLFGWLMVDRSLSSARARFEIRTRIVSSLKGDSGDDWATVQEIFHRNWTRNRGAHTHMDVPHAPEGIAAIARARALYGSRIESPDLDQVHLKYIRRFLDLAGERGIPVVWVLPPMLPEVRARMDEIGLTTIETELVELMRAAYPGLLVLDGRDAGYTAPAFCDDAVHLNRTGANAFSRDLADVLRHHLGNPVTNSPIAKLPRYRPGPMEATMEDFAHSSKVVKLRR